MQDRSIDAGTIMRWYYNPTNDVITLGTTGHAHNDKPELDLVCYVNEWFYLRFYDKKQNIQNQIFRWEYASSDFILSNFFFRTKWYICIIQALHKQYTWWVNWGKQCNIQWSCIRQNDDFDGAAVDSLGDKPELESVCFFVWLVNDI